MKDETMTIREYRQVRGLTRQWHLHPFNIRHAPTGGYLFEDKKRQVISHYRTDPAAGKLDLIAQQRKGDSNA